ncbi:Serine/threonine-protein kinase PKZ1 [Phytophthora citrophthora]|uniref:Serine/threonine-protein kinase PKZ1 n=1 Tax=Phytophthora citrophthora TaxID=4793 RepID=A0AAD9LSY2_9STRA|nr:Serine/threonine-protein kinase PKZ1 [Phytophthora citrophthora]
MQAVVGIRGALRLSGSGVRVLALTRNALHLAVSFQPLQSATRGNVMQFHVCPWRHAAGEGRSVNKRLLAVGATFAAISAIAGGDSLCEALEDDTESGDVACNLCDDNYFDAEYEPKKLLGCGTFGVVMQCVHKQTGRVAAVKMVHDIAGNQKEVEREKMTLECLERAGGHDGIISFDGSYYHNDFHYLVLEYVPGISLHSFVEKHRTLDATWSLQLVSQLASALQFMHQADIVHRDLKPENVMALVKDSGDAKENNDVTLKIIDFGSAGRASQPEAADKAGTTTLSGTRCYWPPEVLQRQGMTAAMDMWALGCILYILISGRHPFDLTGCSTEEEVLQRVKTEPVSFLLPVWHDIPAETKELIRGLLEKDPRHRLSAAQVMEHPAIVEATKEL